MSKKVWVWIIVILVVVLVIWKLPSLLGKTWEGLGLTNPIPSSTPGSQAGRTLVKSTPGPSLTYDQAVRQYGDLRIQIDEKCQFIPGSLTLKKGTKVMLDNRSKEAKTLNVGGETIVLPGLNWRIVTITTNNPLPYDFGIDCQSTGGSTENGLLIKIQARILEGL